MDLIQKFSKLGYKHHTELTMEELDKLPLNNSNKLIEYFFIQKWLREKHKLFVYVLDDDRIGKYYWGVSNLFSSSENPDFNTYEEALEVGLQQALKFIK